VSKRSFADIKAMKKPNEVSVELILDPELTRTLTELERRLITEKRRDERENRAAKAPAIQKEIDALADKVEEAKVEFTFKDPGRQKFDELVEACPPTDDDKKRAKDSGDVPPSWSPEKFVPGVLALASFDPDLTLDDAVEIYDKWGRGDVEALFNTALQTCLEQASVPFTRKDTDAILASVQNLITQQNEESPTPGT
jgi:hypothetical protein